MAELQCSPRIVKNVKGFESGLPELFSLHVVGGFTVEQTDPFNNHNDGNVGFFCQPLGSGFFSNYQDMFAVSGGRKSDDSYQFQFDFRLDSNRDEKYKNRIPIYNGRVFLSYNPKTGHFSYSGRQFILDVKGNPVGEKEWLPCDIHAYLSVVSAVLTCAEKNKKIPSCDAEVARILAGGLKAIDASLIDATLYTAGKDCVFDPSQRFDNLDVGQRDPGW